MDPEGLEPRPEADNLVGIYAALAETDKEAVLRDRLFSLTLDAVMANVASLGAETLKMGAAVAMVKCGHRGLYVCTADKARLEKMGAAACGDVENWANRELWFPVYEEEKFVGALGSGDSAIAGFLSAFVRGLRRLARTAGGDRCGRADHSNPDARW